MNTLLPRVRKTLLVVHLMAAAAWIGIDVLVGVLVLAGWLSDDQAVRAIAYQALGTFVVTPMLAAAVACLASGVVLGVGTRWGLVRYWWVAIKLVLNVAMCALIIFALRPGMPGIRQAGDALAGGGSVSQELTDLFFPPAVSLALLTFATILSVFKPWGRIRPGPARRPTPAKASSPSSPSSASSADYAVPVGR